jgi:hypothetical protein
MKVQSRVLTLILVCLLCVPLAVPIPAQAASPSEKDTAEEAGVARYRVEFNEDISIISTINLQNLSLVSNELDEVVFTVNAGKDEFTIGFYVGESDFDIDVLLAKIQDTVDDINYDITHEERIAGNAAIQLDELEVKYFDITTIEAGASTRSLTPEIVQQLSGVRDFYSLDKPGASEALHEELPTIENGARANTIGGSYHYLGILVDQTYTYWHNQLTGSNTICNASILSPHAGDGNNRYASGFQWFPDYVDVNFYTDVAANENRTKLWYKYTTSTLAKLNVDSNEALEMEVVFYNYTNASTVSNRGHAFQLLKSGSTWATNQPNSYRDTAFCDSEDEVSFCVGVDDTSDLKANTWYYWYINGTKGTTSNNYANDGRFKVVAQRGYRALGSGTWSVFSEEHESILSLGLSSNNNWVPANQNAWDLAEANDDWNFVASTDPVK